MVKRKRASPTIPMKGGKIDLAKIKKVAKADKYTYVFFEDPRHKECLIIPQKFSESWWEKATKNDVHRVKVC